HPTKMVPAFYHPRPSTRHISDNPSSQVFSWRQLHGEITNSLFANAFLIGKCSRLMHGITGSAGMALFRSVRGCSNCDGESYRAKTTDRDRKSARVDSSTAPTPGNAMDSFAASPIGPDDYLNTCDRTDFLLGAEACLRSPNSLCHRRSSLLRITWRSRGTR